MQLKNNIGNIQWIKRLVTVSFSEKWTYQFKPNRQLAS